MRSAARAALAAGAEAAVTAAAEERSQATASNKASGSLLKRLNSPSKRASPSRQRGRGKRMSAVRRSLEGHECGNCRRDEGLPGDAGEAVEREAEKEEEEEEAVAEEAAPPQQSAEPATDARLTKLRSEYQRARAELERLRQAGAVLEREGRPRLRPSDDEAAAIRRAEQHVGDLRAGLEQIRRRVREMEAAEAEAAERLERLRAQQARRQAEANLEFHRRLQTQRRVAAEAQQRYNKARMDIKALEAELGQKEEEKEEKEEEGPLPADMLQSLQRCLQQKGEVKVRQALEKLAEGPAKASAEAKEVVVDLGDTDDTDDGLEIVYEGRRVAAEDEAERAGPSGLSLVNSTIRRSDSTASSSAFVTPPNEPAAIAARDDELEKSITEADAAVEAKVEAFKRSTSQNLVLLEDITQRLRATPEDPSHHNHCHQLQRPQSWDISLPEPQRNRGANPDGGAQVDPEQRTIQINIHMPTSANNHQRPLHRGPAQRSHSPASQRASPAPHNDEQMDCE